VTVINPESSGRARLVVVRLSDSFAEFWPLVAGEVGAQLVERPAVPAEPVPADSVETAAIVLAAGGCEHQLAEFLRRFAAPRGVPILAVGASTGHRHAAHAVAAGAADYFALPEDRDALRDTIAAAVARRGEAVARAALARLESQAHAFREIVGESAALRAALERAARVLPHADATVLVTGETGTGKELLARAVHYGGPRADAPFVEVNCAAIPANLLESELFGYERGAFTDAKTAKPGLFEAAEGGSLFLDEIDRLALELQSKLLRTLEQKTTRRLGSTVSRRFDVRLIAATNADLGAEVRAGRFREDLFYRLNVVNLELPPLRSRGDDVIRLAESFLRKFSVQYALPEPALSAAVRAALLAHSWPGNVRELRNAIERALLLSAPGTLELVEIEARAARPLTDGTLPFPARLADIVEAAARAMLALTAGNRSDAARRLGISRTRLHRLLRGGEVEGHGEGEGEPEAE
jgi:two-component system response regulator HydG